MNCASDLVEKEIYPAICCLGYNRKDSMKRLLDSIDKAIIPYDNISLIVSIDQSDLSDEVERVARDFKWTHGEMIIKRYDKRLGVIEHTMRCGDLVNEYDAIIYLEDDIVVAPGFYVYTVEAIKYYGENPDVFGIGLYSQEWLPTYESKFIPSYSGGDAYGYNGDVSWGQCWLKRPWNDFRKWFNNRKQLSFDTAKIPKGVQKWGEQSWSKYLSVYLIENKKFYMVPYYSYTTCFSESGVHTGISSNIMQVKLSEKTCEMDFSFLPVGRCVKYDSWFDRMDKFVDFISNIPIEDICIDLVGAKHNWDSYEYILTVKKLDYEIIAEYGINLRPIEMNIILNNRGKGITLYKVGNQRTVWNEDTRYIAFEKVFNDTDGYSIRTILKILKRKIFNKLR